MEIFDIKAKLQNLLKKRDWLSIINFIGTNTFYLKNSKEFDIWAPEDGDSFSTIKSRVIAANKAWEECKAIQKNANSFELQTILEKFNNAKTKMEKLPKPPGEPNFEKQIEDWINPNDDFDKELCISFLNLKENLKEFTFLKNTYYQNKKEFATSEIQDRLHNWKSSAYLFENAKDISDFISRLEEETKINSILEKLKEKIFLKDAKSLIIEIPKDREESKLWNSLLKKGEEAYNDICCMSQPLSEITDRKNQKINKLLQVDLLYFKEINEARKIEKLIEERLNLINQINISLTTRPVEELISLNKIRIEMYPSYSVIHQKEIDLKIKVHENLCSLKNEIGQIIPEESTIILLANKIDINQMDSLIKNRLILANSRIKILEELRESINQKQTQLIRDANYIRIVKPYEDLIRDWLDPEAKSHYENYLFAYEKNIILEQAKNAINDINLKESKGIFKQGDDILTYHPEWIKLRKKLVDNTEKAISFESLLVKIENNNDTNMFTSEMAPFKDLVKFPLEYKSYKNEIENIISMKLNFWKLNLREVTPLIGNPLLYLIKWNWINKDVINRIYISLEKNKYPQTKKDATLVKECQPYEYDMHNCGTLIINEFENLENCVLCFWYGTEFYNYQEKKPWIQIEKGPIYYNWNSQKRQWLLKT